MTAPATCDQPALLIVFVFAPSAPHEHLPPPPLSVSASSSLRWGDIVISLLCGLSETPVYATRSLALTALLVRCSAGNPQASGDNVQLFGFEEATVLRRYSDFLWLRLQMVRENPGHIIPVRTILNLL